MLNIFHISIRNVPNILCSIFIENNNNNKKLTREMKCGGLNRVDGYEMSVDITGFKSTHQ